MTEEENPSSEELSTGELAYEFWSKKSLDAAERGDTLAEQEFRRKALDALAQRQADK
jgi:hypothetical protein